MTAGSEPVLVKMEPDWVVKLLSLSIFTSVVQLFSASGRRRGATVPPLIDLAEWPRRGLSFASLDK